MTNSFDDTFRNLVANIITSSEDELQNLTQSDLENKWYFQFDYDESVEWNIYQFQDMLNLYKRTCRRWEEIHNGHVLVVERVRDRYLMPKIDEFVQNLRIKISNEPKV